MAYRFTLTNLTTLATEVLTKDPIGWEDFSYTLKRSDKYNGMMHEFTSRLKFHCNGGGKAFVDAAYNALEVDARVDILIEYDCAGNGTYETLFNGILNFATYTIEDEYTTCQIERSDLIAKFLSRDEISVDLESTTSIGQETITAASTTNIVMPSMVIDLHNEYIINDGYNYGWAESFAGTITFLFNHNAYAQRADFENTNSWSESAWEYNLASQNNVGTPLIELTGIGIDTPITIYYDIHLKGVFTDDETTGGGVRTNDAFRLYLMHGFLDGDGNNNVTFITLFDGPGYSDDNFSYNFDISATGSFQLNAGENVWLVWNLAYDTTNSPTVVVDWTYEESYIRFDANTTYQETTTKSVCLHEAFNQIVDSIADSDNNFYSEFYGRTDSDKVSYGSDGCGSAIALTNGLCIREFDRPISASFNELYDAMNCIHNIGVGYENNKIRVEPISYWYDKTTKIITLPKVNSFQVKDDNKRYFNKINIGYNKWESEFHGGLDDVNAKHEYSTKVASVNNAYSRLCNFLTSSYTIEFTRRKNISYLTTEDWRFDNDRFLLALARDAYGGFLPEFFADSFTAGSNMTQLNTAYNLRLTPKRMLLAHLNTITAGLQKINGQIKFMRGDGNTSLATTKTDIGCPEDYSGVSLAENASINWNDANAENITPIWLPQIYTFEYPLTYDQFKTIKASNKGYIEFYKFSDDIKYGFILSMEYKMQTGMTKFELLKANI